MKCFYEKITIRSGCIRNNVHFDLFNDHVTGTFSRVDYRVEFSFSVLFLLFLLFFSKLYLFVVMTREKFFSGPKKNDLKKNKRDFSASFPHVTGFITGFYCVTFFFTDSHDGTIEG